MKTKTKPADDLPPISAQMQDFLTKSFQAYPGRWFYHLDKFAADIETQLVSRGLVIRDEFPSKGKTLIRYCGAAPDEVPPAVEMTA
jgi:hypothetical protein